MTTVGFIGLGDIGGSVAGHLATDGNRVQGYDIDDQQVAAAADKGVVPMADPEAAVEGAEVVFFSLPGPDAVETVVERVGPTLNPEAVVIDTTTSAPFTTAQIETTLATHGPDVLSAPVSGGKTGAAAGDLSVMVGGDRVLFEACEPLLESFADDVFYVGTDARDGHAVKLLNNYLSYTALVATSEAVVLGDIAGLDRELLLEVFSASTGQNSATNEKLPEQVLTGNYDTGFPLDLTEKDVRLFVEFSDELETPLLLGSMVRQMVGYARSHQGADGDMTRVYDFVEAMMKRESR